MNNLTFNVVTDESYRAMLTRHYTISRSERKVHLLNHTVLNHWKLRNMLPATILALALGYLAGEPIFAQTAVTGALSGVVTDSTGAFVPDSTVTLRNPGTGETRTATTNNAGAYSFSLLAPGTYSIQVTHDGFSPQEQRGIIVNVTETSRVSTHLLIGTVSATVEVSSEQALVQTESSALGRIVDEKAVTGLPLVTRNFTQIVGLSAGVITPVTDASDLGRGSSSSSGGGAGAKLVNGARPTDNNFEMNGIPINDQLGRGAAFGPADPSGGMPTPTPDAIQEFKVQTGQFDAAFGRDAGADVNVVTKLGTNQWHGTVFEFFRNEALNANSYLLKQTETVRPRLRQNQYGFTSGGYLVKNHLFVFGSYQGTKQSNGLTSGCSAIVYSPAFTDDRSAAGLGAVFAGQRGTYGNIYGGVAILADGSNINPIALKLMQLKKPDGSYLIPTPQQVIASNSFDTRGVSAFSSPCSYDDNQFMTNVSYTQNQRSSFALRYFQLTSNANYTLGSSNIPGVVYPSANTFRVTTLTHTFVITPRLVNEAVVGYNQSTAQQQSQSPFTWASLGTNVPADFSKVNGLTVLGSFSIAPQVPYVANQPAYAFQDSVAYAKGNHNIRFGGGMVFNYISIDGYSASTSLGFFSVADLLIGQSGLTNGSPVFVPNVAVASGGVIQYARKYERFNSNAYVQDDWKLTPRLTLNLGFRYDRLGALGDKLGRMSTFNFQAATPTAGNGGSYNGYVVAGNFPGTPPTGVVKSNHNYAINGDNQNAWEPRIGFAFQPFTGSSHVVVRGGFGLYNSESPVASMMTGNIGPPWFVSGQQTLNPTSSLQNPYPASAFVSLSSLPYFPTYGPGGGPAQIQYPNVHFRPGYVQLYNLNTQTDLGHNYMLELGYVGNHAVHLSRGRFPNQAALASPSNPIRGVTTNTTSNASLRVPVLGFSPIALVENQSEGQAKYNSLQASLTKRYSVGLQFLASYTFSKNIDSDGVSIVGDTQGTGDSAPGNQLDPRARYGRTNFDRPHRFVVSYIYDLPHPKNAGHVVETVTRGWQVGGVTTVQTGSALTVTASNASNAYGITGDLAPLNGSCHGSSYANTGDKNTRLHQYFNLSCFNGTVAAPIFPTIAGSPGVTDFAHGSVGVVNGPGQHNWDIALSKRTFLHWPNETANVEFRSEFFNAFNHAQFGNPDSGMSNSTFGKITTLSVSPRIIQFALKVNY